MAEDFVHLHAHDEFSMLDGVGTIGRNVEIAKKKGFRALAQTNHGNASGAIKFAKACKKCDMQAIVGSEIYCVDDPSFRQKKGEAKEKEERHHLIVLAKDWEGFVSLERLLTKAHSELGFYYKPRVSWEDALELKNCVVSTACVSGMLSSHRADELVKKFHEAYGDDFYLEIQPHALQKQQKVNRAASSYAIRHGIKLLATNDFHYANEHEHNAQTALLALQRKDTISKIDKWEQIPGLYMRTRQEMEQAFASIRSAGSTLSDEEIKQALDQTLVVAEKCSFSIPKFDIELPEVSEWKGRDADVVLMKLCREGWQKRFDFAMNSDEGRRYFERYTHEIRLIEQLKFARYFLIVWDIYRFCDKEKIGYNPGRGSSAGSLVCYLLGITDVDPLEYGLIFERFINPERIDLPDMDLDFEHTRREEVYRYLQEQYHVARIPTYNGMNAKMVLRDISRYFEVDLKEVDAVCKEIDLVTAKQDKAALRIETCLEKPGQYPAMADFASRRPRVMEIASVLEGQVRQTGIHAGGVIVSSKPLTERVAVEWRKGDVTINFDMYDISDVGLLKLDVLGLKTVTVLKKTKEAVEARVRRHRPNRENVKLRDFPLDDDATLDEFNRGNTVAVFQFESAGMQRLLRDMAPHDINTLITANAMYRPGPLQFAKTYIANKLDPRRIQPTGNANLDAITRETYGVFIYQEQVMRIAHEVAGYTYPEADALRKKISKSMGKEQIEVDREKFVSGCVKHGGLSNEAADRIFTQIVDFGRYAFNKSHATTYTMLAYQAMWFRTHFPAEFLSAQIAYCDDDSDRRLFRSEAVRLGVDYLPPDINKSQEICCVETDKAIRGGLNEIDGIGSAVIYELLRTRGDRPFGSFIEFNERLENKRIVNSRIMQIILGSSLFRSLHTKDELRRFAKRLEDKAQSKAKKEKEEVPSLFPKESKKEAEFSPRSV